MMKRAVGASFLSFLTICAAVTAGRLASAYDLVSHPELALKLKGSYKNLQFNTHRQSNGDFLEANVNRLRTEWDAKLLRVFSAKLVWDNELIFGNYIDSEIFAARQAQRDQPYGDLEYELVQSHNVFYGQNFYRAYGEIDLGVLDVRVGRQKIEWGVMRLFSPGDLFHPLPLFDVEKMERVGATAVNALFTPWPDVKVNAVYAFDRDPDRSRIAGRVTRTVGHFDVSAFGGKFLKDHVTGFDFTGDVLRAGVRGEFYFDDAALGDNFIQAAGGVDYGFANTLYVALEYFHNGQGTNDALTAPLFLPSAAQIRSVHKDFAGFQLKYELTPLWTVSGMSIIDLNGGSLFMNPETKYAFKEWLEVTLGAHLPIGAAQGEFTAIPNLYYLQTQLFF